MNKESKICDVCNKPITDVAAMRPSIELPRVAHVECMPKEIYWRCGKCEYPKSGLAEHSRHCPLRNDNPLSSGEPWEATTEKIAEWIWQLSPHFSHKMMSGSVLFLVIVYF